ncbi:MAG: hypothetical protein CMJ31_03545 [Phycisphaerae bacterium]|nr:hypothetical protein [Phycisphaerae bacterium]
MIISHSTSIRVAGFLAAAGALCGLTQAQTVTIDAGEVLDRSDLEAGEFGGQNFILGSGTTFEVRSGGQIGALREGIRVIPPNAFDFGGATINLGAGAVFEHDSAVSNVVINVDGGLIDRSFDAGPGVDLNFLSGTVDHEFAAHVNSQVSIFDGSFGDNTRIYGGTTDIFGGNFAFRFEARSGSTVNISGGLLTSNFVAMNGSTVAISGGIIGRNSDLQGGSAVSMTGGAFGERFRALSGSSLSIVGGEFTLNGSPVSSLPDGGLQPGDALAGTLANGDVFLFAEVPADVFSGVISDSFASGTTTLVSAPLDTADPEPMTVATGIGPSGLRPGQTLTLTDGGALPSYFVALGAALNIEGGFVGDDLDAMNSVVSVSGGEFESIDAFDGSEVDLSGDAVGDRVGAYDNAVMTVSGETAIANAAVRDDSELSIASGQVLAVSAFEDATINLTGGLIGERLTWQDDSLLTIEGAEFRLNGSPAVTLPTSLEVGDTLAATLADGTVIIIGRQFLEPGTTAETAPGPAAISITPTTIPPADPTPISVQNGAGPEQLRPGQSLTLSGDGSLPDYFRALDATLDINGGSVGTLAKFAGSQVTMTGGAAADRLEVYSGSEFTLDGGTIGEASAAYAGSVVNIASGAVARSFRAFGAATVNISGGAIAEQLLALAESKVSIAAGEVGYDLEARAGAVLDISGGALVNFIARDGSEINISGGVFSGNVYAASGSAVNILGESFFINGAPIEGLTPGEPFTITRRTGVLTGMLADGSPLNFDLAAEEVFEIVDVFEVGSTLTVTLVGGSCNDADLAEPFGELDISDVVTFLQAFGAMDEAADLAAPFGAYDIADVVEFLRLFGIGCPS